MIKYDPNWKLPWWTGGAIKLVEKYLALGVKDGKPDSVVFEYGTGMSSRWLAERCDIYVGVEDNPEWYKRVKEMLSDLKHSDVHLRKGLDYTNLIRAVNRTFDLVVIDGINRRDCITAAMGKLKSGGVMVVDDAQAEVHWAMQRPLASWIRKAFLTDGKDSQHPGKITMCYMKP